MQKTDFPFVAIVHDDCSTDGSAAIIREYAEKYPDIIKPIFETENQYSKKDGTLNRIMIEVMEATGAKYVAFCEGDDYWIDPLKLKKQVDFLESHPEYGLVHTNYRVYYNKQHYFKEKGADKYKTPKEGEIFKYIFQECSIKTLTVCMRRRFLRDMPDFNNGEFNGDRAIFFEVSMKSKIHFLDEQTGTYRVLLNSACHYTNINKQYEYMKSLRKLDEFYMNRGAVSDTIRQQVMLKWLMEDFKYCIRSGNWFKFKEIKKLNTGKIIFDKYNILYCIARIKPFFYLIHIIWKYIHKN
ncbi:MAG: glycosyltransferase [Muribaculum sp.]|nr:glycosyltransferase [Muribaculum sp.]